MLLSRSCHQYSKVCYTHVVHSAADQDRAHCLPSESLTYTNESQLCILLYFHNQIQIARDGNVVVVTAQ